MGRIKTKNSDFIEKLTRITQITQIILRAQMGIFSNTDDTDEHGFFGKAV